MTQDSSPSYYSFGSRVLWKCSEEHSLQVATLRRAVSPAIPHQQSASVSGRVSANVCWTDDSNVFPAGFCWVALAGPGLSPNSKLPIEWIVLWNLCEVKEKTSRRKLQRATSAHVKSMQAFISISHTEPPFPFS